jgi:hypothetical protein
MGSGPAEKAATRREPDVRYQAGGYRRRGQGWPAAPGADCAFQGRKDPPERPGRVSGQPSTRSVLPPVRILFSHANLDPMQTLTEQIPGSHTKPQSHEGRTRRDYPQITQISQIQEEIICVNRRNLRTQLFLVVLFLVIFVALCEPFFGCGRMQCGRAVPFVPIARPGEKPGLPLARE